MDERMRRLLFDEIPSWVSVQDRSLRIVAANRALRADLGDPLGRFCYEAIKGRSEKCTRCPVEQTFQDGLAHDSEEVVGAQGRDRSVIVHTAPIRDAAGEIAAVLEIFTDITQVKQLQQRYLTLFGEAPCYVSVQDRDLKIVEHNRRFEADFGRGVGRQCFEIYKHRSEPCVVCPVAASFQDGQVHESEEVVTSEHGIPRDVLCHAAPIRDPAGEIRWVMEMSTDITRLRQIQSQLASLGLIVGSVSHGIKGVLNGLEGGLYLMESGLAKDKPERISQGLAMARRNMDGIRRMVMNILYYARDREMAFEPVEIGELCDAVAQVLRSRAQAVGVELRVTAGEGQIEADRNAVESLLVNLVDNSIDACRVDGKKVAHQVELTARIDADQVVFTVSDNGLGMDRETREKAFSLFFTSKGAEGTGLGLFIAQKIARSHGGTIEVESTAGAGTRFTVTLPCERPGAAAAPG
ncbi:MAG: PAS domain-containing protein [Deltaproteobacteria bacterium]|nr:PAS domain-containing protein [Deltaproteobacteria bacterium]